MSLWSGNTATLAVEIHDTNDPSGGRDLTSTFTSDRGGPPMSMDEDREGLSTI